jgi:hypothetical protein
MPRQGTSRSVSIPGCNGTMTCDQTLKVHQNADPPVQPGDTIGLAPDPNFAVWICDADWHHVSFDKP